MLYPTASKTFVIFTQEGSSSTNNASHLDKSNHTEHSEVAKDSQSQNSTIPVLPYYNASDPETSMYSRQLRLAIKTKKKKLQLKKEIETITQFQRQAKVQSCFTPSAKKILPIK